MLEQILNYNSNSNVQMDLKSKFQEVNEVLCNPKIWEKNEFGEENVMFIIFNKLKLY